MEKNVMADAWLTLQRGNEPKHTSPLNFLYEFIKALVDCVSIFEGWEMNNSETLQSKVLCTRISSVTKTSGSSEQQGL